jgi:hypothetical protein
LPGHLEVAAAEEEHRAARELAVDRELEATVPALPANTITPRRTINNYQVADLINLCYVALGLRRGA